MGAAETKMERAAARRFESLFSWRIAHTISLRVFEGESLAAICREPGMPCHKTVYNWIEREPEFAAMLRAAQAKARLKARAALVARRAARLARPKRRNCPGSASTFDPDMAEFICQELEAGRSLRAICRRRGLPSFGTVYNWLQAFPEFAARYADARGIQAELMAARALDLALAVGPGEPQDMMDAVTALKVRASRLLPRGWGDEDDWGEVVVVIAPPLGELAGGSAA
jgi:transposase-like protein